MQQLIYISPYHGINRSAPGDDHDDDHDEEFQPHLDARAATSSHTTHDYYQYVNVPDDPMIQSGGWQIIHHFQI